MTVDANRRQITETGDSLRIDVYLQNLPPDAVVSPDQFSELICRRSRRLAAHILGSDSEIGRDRSVALPEDAARKLMWDLTGLALERDKLKLCELAAKHVRITLTNLLGRQPSIIPTTDDDGQAAAFGTTELATELATADSTINPGQLDAWTEFQKGLGRLEPDLRQMIDLVFFSGLRVSAAAAMLSIPSATAQARWRAAKIHLAMLGANLLADGS
jgi:DNA-directed RNA polymerase specialized sigma24 family protein